jgi:hypothetical protein
MRRAEVAYREYDFDMRPSKAALLAAFGVATILLSSVFPAAAQIKGVPTSVTSTGFGGHFDRMPGTPPSVTSLGPRGYNDPTHLFVGSGFPPANPGQFHHRRQSGQGGPSRGFYPVYTPMYVVDPSLSYGPADSVNPPMNESGAAIDNQNASAGPTIFDRRAPGESSQSVKATYVKRSTEEPRQPAAQPELASQAEAPLQELPRTLLMFKDGRQLEVQNYAIVGSMLYDLTPGRHGKIAISDLDLAATAKQNDERGTDFQLPGNGLN